MFLRRPSIWRVALMLLWAANLPAEAPSGTSIQPQPKDQTCAISGVVVRKDDKAPLKVRTSNSKTMRIEIESAQLLPKPVKESAAEKE